MLAATTSLIAASYEAKCSGVSTGTSVPDALRLCPNITLAEARPKLYRQIHFSIRDAVETVSPLDDVLSVDEMTVQMWRNESQLSDALRFGAAIQDPIRYGVGECGWRLIRRQQIGHSNVLAPHLRTSAGAWSVTVRMAEKCAERARAEQYHARKLYVGVRS